MEEENKIYCQGDSSIEGHPKIYLKIDHITNSAICPYCSKKFLKIT
ncbi:MAG: zinc-finger domain-containing protein [Rickettsiaceae bacterium]|nr:zinc-finger domain-containing protein [Rickettsiaceae bacterium]